MLIEIKAKKRKKIGQKEQLIERKKRETRKDRKKKERNKQGYQNTDKSISIRKSVKILSELMFRDQYIWHMQHILKCITFDLRVVALQGG